MTKKGITENSMLKQMKELKEIKEFDKAIEIGQKIIEKTPDDDDVLAILGDLYMIQGDIAESENKFLKSVSINPKNGYALRLLGDIYLSQKKYDEAVSYYMQTIEVGDPMNIIWSYTGLCNVYNKTENKRKSTQMLKKAIELAGDNDTKKEIKLKTGTI